MKTLRLLNACGKGKVRTFSDSAAKKLLERGMAEEIDEQEEKKPKAKKKK